ncbi:radical SAM domain-containing protein [Thermoanaerobacter kivui]|uniref:Radical SAM domain-containing protein n=2 Tax=Thermoanaerobacter kivui TaxID=2325 RepID=A0A097ASL4_THEKI|nr:radical SAM domain-containing protein [Thermoanaerobacter kivui]
MSWDTAESILKFIKKQNKENSHMFLVQFTGGEPLLNLPLIERFVKESRKEGLSCIFQIQTNGTLLNDINISKLKNLDIGIGVSIDGVPEVNDIMRPYRNRCSRSSTVDVLKGMELLKESGICVNVTSVLTKKSLLNLNKFIDLVYYIGNVKGISFNVLRPTGNAFDMSVPSEEEIALNVKAALKRADMHEKITNRTITFKFLERLKKYGYREECRTFNGNSIFINPNGEVYPCPSLAGQEDFYIGNIMDEDFQIKTYIGKCPYIQQCRMLDRIFCFSHGYT